MKKLLFTLLLIASLSSFARLGETLEQCKKRYGKPILSFYSKKNNKHVFRNGVYIIDTFFRNPDKRCSLIIFAKTNSYIKKDLPRPMLFSLLEGTDLNDTKNILAPLSKVEIFNFKKTYAPKEDWKAMKKHGSFITKDDKIFCSYSQHSIFFYRPIDK